jgi:hypothetical protein
MLLYDDRLNQTSSANAVSKALNTVKELSSLSLSKIKYALAMSANFIRCKAVLITGIVGERNDGEYIDELHPPLPGHSMAHL